MSKDASTTEVNSLTLQHILRALWDEGSDTKHYANVHPMMRNAALEQLLTPGDPIEQWASYCRLMLLDALVYMTSPEQVPAMEHLLHLATGEKQPESEEERDALEELVESLDYVVDAPGKSLSSIYSNFSPHLDRLLGTLGLPGINPQDRGVMPSIKYNILVSGGVNAWMEQKILFLLLDAFSVIDMAGDDDLLLTPRQLELTQSFSLESEEMRIAREVTKRCDDEIVFLERFSREPETAPVIYAMLQHLPTVTWDQLHEFTQLLDEYNAEWALAAVDWE